MRSLSMTLECPQNTLSTVSIGTTFLGESSSVHSPPLYKYYFYSIIAIKKNIMGS